MARLLSALAMVLGVPSALLAQGRTTILTPVDRTPSWRDMAYLAAIPASEVANRDSGSLIALDASGQIGPEIRDYAKRYRPQSVIALAPSAPAFSLKTAWGEGPVRFDSLAAGSAEEAALALSRRFWKSSPVAVVASDQDFGSALVASSLAGLRKAPLLFVSDQEASPSVTGELKRLGTKQVLFVGAKAPRLNGSVVRLADAKAVMGWTRDRKIPVRYLAVVNPQDRANFVTRKLSMVGAQLAAGRHGLVAPLDMATEWKRPFTTTEWKGPLPAGVPKSQAPVQAGELAVDGEKTAFLLTGRNDDEGLRLAVDRAGDGRYSESYVSGDTLQLGGRRWAVSLGRRTKFGASRVHLTWPTAGEMVTRLESFYEMLGSPPEHLCLVGFPDALPHAIIGHGGVVEEQASDLPFALVKGSSFAQIGVARLVAENLSFGTLYAARALTYSHLLAPAWAEAAGQAEWENKMGPLFENVGFRPPYQLADENVPWETPPRDGRGGRRAASFAQDSPLAECAVLTHSQHSSWQTLGNMFRWDANVLLAPTVVESGGCSTASLDRDPENRSVVARLLRLGALGFSGGSRELPAQTQPLRMEFWNGILAGETLGQAHRRALNAGLLVAKEEGEGPQGAYRYCTQVSMQFGDPALAIRRPAPPQVKPAHTVLRGNRLTVFAPGRWWVVKGNVPPDWTQWAGKDLFYLRGPGAFSMAHWIGEGRDQETTMVQAEFTSARRVKEIKLLDSPPSPLGWSGKWYEEAHSDGTYTYRFAVRMVDFDQVSGKIRGQVGRLEFGVGFEFE